MSSIRLGLSQSLRTEQRLVQSPQMIQAMQILQTPLMELKDQVEQELQENVFLERKEDQDNGEPQVIAPPEPEMMQLEDRLQRQFAEAIDQLESRTEFSQRNRTSSSLGGEEGDKKLEALNNTPGNGISLPEHLMAQARMLELDPDLLRVVEHVVFSLDADARLAETPEQIAQSLIVSIPLAQAAILVVRRLEPIGIAARDLRDRLLMQIDHLATAGYVRPLTRVLVDLHLDDLARNKLPKIAKETGASLDEIKESWDFLRTRCNPHPANDYSVTNNAGVVPDVVIEEIEGHFEVKSQRGSVPELAISPNYRELLKEAKNDPNIYEYLRRKVESAKWFIEAVHQRQNTIERIAGAVVRRQDAFLRHGIQHLKPLKMQDVADEVRVHISTISRAISGKFIQTPQGIFDMKRFFSGGTQNDSGEMVSQRAVKDTLKNICEQEDKSSPLSDDDLVTELAKKGIHIARRTVTKYRKALQIDSSSRRKQF
ncbi:MAG: RNA polymerase sigma-54 factor [Planctomycetes bacterium]|nr:RNA polymerase sigma-54 factor [Planctomycetota bacterium]